MNKQMINKIKEALKEDIPTIDVSSHFLFNDEISNGQFIAKEDGVISGIDVCKKVFEIVDSETELELLKHNGDLVLKGEIIAKVKGKTKSILQSERVGLNFLQRMSGIASMTRKFVDATKGSVKILDTRKTLPGLRIMEKYAVRAGGGYNHRFGLYDMVC